MLRPECVTYVYYCFFKRILVTASLALSSACSYVLNFVRGTLRYACVTKFDRKLTLFGAEEVVRKVAL